MFDVGEAEDLEALDRRLYLCRRRIEKRVREASVQDFYVCSLSSRSLIYKGMFLAEQLANFYPDLNDERFVSAFAIFHQRYSTNTFPTWRLAQPFRMLAHNGEINTLKGNVNWMKNHEFKMASALFGEAWRRHQADHPARRLGYRRTRCGVRSAGARGPLRAARQNDADARSVVEESLDHAGSASRDVCLCQCGDGAVGRARRHRRHRWALGDRRHGPQRPAAAALCHHRGRPAVRRLGSRHGRARRGAYRPQGPRRPRADDRARSGRKAASTKTARSRTSWRANIPYQEWTKKIVELEPIIGPGPEPRLFDKDVLRRRQAAAGFTMEDLELILHPMVEDGKEPLGSMGDDTPLAVLSDRYRPLSHYFRQNFCAGDESADRSVARRARDEPQDALPQSRQCAGAGRDAGRGLSCWKAR